MSSHTYKPNKPQTAPTQKGAKIKANSMTRALASRSAMKGRGAARTK